MAVVQRSHFYAPIINGSPLSLPNNTSVRLLEPGTSTPITGPLYTTLSGGTTQSQPWTPVTGIIDVYLEDAQVIDLELTPFGGGPTVIHNLPVGVSPKEVASVRDWGAKGNGTTDDSDAINEALADIPSGSSLFFPDGVYGLGNMLQAPTVDSITLWAAIAGQNRSPSAVLTALPGANLPAIMATQEWISNGVTPDTAQGLVLSGLGFDGGGFRAGRTDTSLVETTSNTLHGLVMHGSGWKLDHCFVLSANGHGIYVPGVGQDGSSPLASSGSHENMIFGCGVRWTGLDGVHGGPTAQDSWMAMCKIQYAGNNCIFMDNNNAGWEIASCHPSWGAWDLMRFASGWNYRIHDNYLGSVGQYRDNTGYNQGPTGHTTTHYAINMSGSKIWNIHNNSTNTNTGGGQVDAVNNIYLGNSVGVCIGNTIIYQVSPPDNYVGDSTGIENHSTGASYLAGNIADHP